MSHSAGRRFMEETRIECLPRSDQDRGVPQPPLELPCTGSGPVIELPRPADLTLGDMPLRRAIDTRSTLRRYAERPLTLEELSYLLWCTQGVRHVERGRTSRTVPSAGARHAFETLLLVNRVEGLAPGLHQFLASRHQLAPIELTAAVAPRLVAACGGQEQVGGCAVTFAWVAVPARMCWRYGERGYRYLHLDAGHVCQNLYLAAESIGCGACAIAAFDDAALNAALGLDGVEQFAIYLASVGKRG